MNLFSAAASALPYPWHHVVAQQTRGQMEPFINGKCVGPSQSDTQPKDHATFLQGRALESRPDQDLNQLGRTFWGKLAELAMYNLTLMARTNLRFYCASQYLQKGFCSERSP